MKKILEEFEETINAINKLKDVQEFKLNEPISKGKWTIREIVGHLYYWDKHILEKMVPLMSTGVNLPQFPNHEQHNNEAISSLRDNTVESIIDAFIETRKELIDSMSKVEENVRFTIGNGKRQFSGESFIKVFIKHDIHHLKQINSTLNN